MRRILTAVKAALHEPTPGVDVHFHQGPAGTPSPCYDDGCPIPRLHVARR